MKFWLIRVDYGKYLGTVEDCLTGDCTIKTKINLHNNEEYIVSLSPNTLVLPSKEIAEQVAHSLAGGWQDIEQVNIAGDAFGWKFAKANSAMYVYMNIAFDNQKVVQNV